VSAEEILKFDGKRMMCTIDAVKGGALQVHRATGEPVSVPLGEIVVIYFKGREPRSIRSGMQEFHFINGDKIRAEIKDVEGDNLVVNSYALGPYRFGMDNLDGFLTIPIEGMSGRRAEELVFDESPDETGLLDQVLDRRCVYYEGVIEEINPKKMVLDHERLMKPVDLNIIYLAGVRMAEKAKKKAPGLPNELFCRVYTRDGSTMDGFVQNIEFGKWHIKSMWDAKKTMRILTDEIVLVEVLNGNMLYISQLDPVKVNETTVLAPKQHYRKNRNCRGDVMTIGDNSYTWGIGVHATSELTFKIGKIFKAFEASIGVDGQVGNGGSVVFKVIGDGNELYKSPLVRGSDKEVRRVSVPVEGVEKLTLKVENGGDLDLGDYANWAMAKLVR
jgi:hypothetical protein